MHISEGFVNVSLIRYWIQLRFCSVYYGFTYKARYISSGSDL